MSEDNNRPAETNDLLKKMRAITADLWGESPDVPAEPKAKSEKPARVVVKSPEIGIDNLWMTADETIDWTDALAHEYPADGLTNIRLWSFYHKQAEAVLSGDTKAYAEVLKKANPLGELTAFAEGISMRTPDADRVEAQFNIRKEYLEADGKKYLSAMGVRIARDLLACLPVNEVGVKAVQDGKTVMEVTYCRDQMMHRNFSFLDPVKLTEECNAKFTL
ncbi:MAG: hypothetical protein ABTA22_10225 [Clostridia bacterium]